MKHKKVKIGMAVQLVGGGPVLTVLTRARKSGVWCGWFDNNRGFRQKALSTQALVELKDYKQKKGE